MDESVQDLRKKLQETLERNRAFVAGMAFGVPAEASLEYTDAIVEDLVKAVTEWADEPLVRGWPDQSRSANPDDASNDIVVRTITEDEFFKQYP